MHPQIDISNLVKDAPHARRHNNIGKISRQAFVFAACVGSQFSTAAPSARLTLSEEKLAVTLTGVSDSPLNDIEIPGIVTRPEYQALLRLERIANLEDDWDGYDSPAISKKAIKRTQQAIRQFGKDVFTGLQVWPNEYGGVLIRLRKDNRTVFCCDFGDNCMSYYSAIPGEDVRECDFAEYNDDSFKALAAFLSEVIKALRNG